MIFSLFSACGLILNYLKMFVKKGVHYKTLYLVLDGHVYLDSFSMDKKNEVWDFSLSVEVNSLCYNKYLKTRPTK